MKIISLKSVLQAAFLCLVILTTVLITKTIYQDLKEVVQSQPKVSAASCLYDMLN